MVGALLNWTSLVGLFLVFYGLATAPLSIAQIFFTLQRGADWSPAVLAKAALVVLQAVGRFVMLPLCGVLLFFQGWRLDPVLQLSLFLLVFGVVAESLPSIVSDYSKWKKDHH